jgi:hypothetical protein
MKTGRTAIELVLRTLGGKCIVISLMARTNFQVELEVKWSSQRGSTEEGFFTAVSECWWEGQTGPLGRRGTIGREWRAGEHRIMIRFLCWALHQYN